MWSCLAGFIEPGESIEDAVRRETLEEAGIVCGEVKYFASQPWPFPMSLMIGCHARATSREITVDREELEDARWFTRDEVALMFAGAHPEQICIPPPIAIAHHIIRAWVEEGDGVLRLTPGMCCAPASRSLDMVFRVKRFPRAGSEDAGERILHRQWRQRGQRRGRDRASRRARALCRSARRPPMTVGDMFLALAAREDIDCSACPRLLDVPTSISAICIDARGERAIANFRDERLRPRGRTIRRRSWPASMR